MCKLAAKVDTRIKVFDYEIKNKLGGETYYLFKKLKSEETIMVENKTYPIDKFRFYMIIGLDNANNFHTWVNFEELEKLAKFIVVPRKGGCGSRVHDSHVRIIIYEGIMWGEKTLYHKSWGVVKGININTKIKIIDYKGLSSDYASDIYINK